MSDLQTVQVAEQHAHHLLFGYLRSIENKHTHIAIPVEVGKICLRYFKCIERFTGFRTECFETTENQMTIRCIKPIDFNNHSIYGNVWVPSTSKSIFKWTLEIAQMGGEIYFGFASKFDIKRDFSEASQDGRDQASKPNYAFSPRSLCVNGVCQYEKMRQADAVFQTNSVVTITLDLVNAQIRIKSDERAENLIFGDIEVKESVCYIFAFQMQCSDDCVKLLRFEH